MLRKPHLQLIASHSVRHGIRGGAGLIALLFTLVIGLALASVVIAPLERAVQIAEQLASRQAGVNAAAQVNAEVIKVTRKAIDWAVSPSDAQLDFLTRDHPAVISAILVLLFLITPLLACLGGFNQTAGDIATKGLRFLLIRTERPNIFIGRFVGTFLFSAATFAGLFAILALYMSFKVHVHPPGEMIAWLFQSYFRLLVFALPYVALCAWVSSAIDSPFGSLVIALLLVYLFPALVAIASGINEGAHYLQYVTPWGYRWWLLAPVGGQLLGGIAVMFGFTAAFLTAGLKHFSARDL
jgi:ABC-type transport system involved in multi-copper enzyme maturation permease subunit